MRHLEGIRHRGPDAVWSARWRTLDLGFTRLSIVNPELDLGIVNSSDENIVVLLNGELWNCVELRQLLHLPDYASEFEIIRECYKHYGKNFVSRLDGMFVIAILDKVRGRYLVFRDAVGIKPLFYHFSRQQEFLIIASDIKTIASHKEFDAKLNWQFLANELVFGYSDYCENVFEEVRQLPPSHYLDMNLLCRPREPTPIAYRPLVNVQSPKVSDEAQLQILTESVKKHYAHTSFYPIGVLLSGGIDSSLLLFLARQAGLEQIVCFFFGYPTNPDFTFARQVAELANYPLCVIEPDADAMAQQLSAMCYYGSGALNYNYYFFQQVKSLYPHIKVVWCGEGADELYYGYHVHVDPRRECRRIRRKISKLPRKTRFMNRFEKMVAECNGKRLMEAFQAFYMNEQLVNDHLVPFDHASMAFSLELRVPFLDSANIALVQQMPLSMKATGHTRKKILKTLLRELSGISNTAFYERHKIPMPAAWAPVSKLMRACTRSIISCNTLADYEFKDFVADEFEYFWNTLRTYIFSGTKRGTTLCPLDDVVEHARSEK